MKTVAHVERDAFARGMVCAAAMIARYQTQAEDILRASGMTTVRRMRAARVDESDIATLRPLVRRIRLRKGR